MLENSKYLSHERARNKERLLSDRDKSVLDLVVDLAAKPLRDQIDLKEELVDFVKLEELLKVGRGSSNDYPRKSRVEGRY